MRSAIGQSREEVEEKEKPGLFRRDDNGGGGIERGKVATVIRGFAVFVFVWFLQTSAQSVR